MTSYVSVSPVRGSTLSSATLVPGVTWCGRIVAAARRDQDFKALRLALKLSRSYVQYVDIDSYFATLSYSATLLSRIGKCKQIRYLSLNFAVDRLELNTLKHVLSELPSLYYLCVRRGGTDDIDFKAVFRLLKPAIASKSLEVFCILDYNDVYVSGISSMKLKVRC